MKAIFCLRVLKFYKGLIPRIFNYEIELIFVLTSYHLLHGLLPFSVSYFILEVQINSLWKMLKKLKKNEKKHRNKLII